MADSIDIDAIRQANPLAAIVQPQVRLNRAGNELRWCCPFHNDQTPSFYIFDCGRGWICFGCGAGGDVFDYVQRLHGVGMKGDIKGNQYSIGASAPVALDGALRLAARFAYGDYAYKGTRVTNDGTASFGNVNGSSTVWGGGFEYLKSSKRLSVGFSAEVLSVLNKVDAFTETGVGALEALSVHAQRERYEVLGADLKLGYQFQPNIQGFMAVSLDQDLSDRLHAVSANVSVESVNMTVMNPGFTATRVDGTIGARFDLTDAIRFTIEGNAGNASRYGGKASVSIRF